MWYHRGMAARACRVTIKDMEGVDHTVSVTASTLYEAIALGLVADGLAELILARIEPEEWKAFDQMGRLFKNINTPEDYEQARAEAEDLA